MSSLLGIIATGMANVGMGTGIGIGMSMGIARDNFPSNCTKRFKSNLDPSRHVGQNNCAPVYRMLD